MLSKKQKIKEGFVGVKTMTNQRTGEKVSIDWDDTPVFTREEVERLHIGQPDMKSYSEMTEEEKKIFHED